MNPLSTENEIAMPAERWITQTRFYDPTQPPEVCTGNCTEAALASIFGLPLDSVPSFYGLTSSNYWEALERFVLSRGYWLAMMGANYVPEGFYLADGPSERGCGHFVVMCAGQLAHDPHPSRAGLKSVENVWMLVPHDPAAVAPNRDAAGQATGGPAWACIEHLAEIARQWEPDHSSGADRRGWLLAQDAKDDAKKLLAELQVPGLQRQAADK